jgi:hypothetical protein
LRGGRPTSAGLDRADNRRLARPPPHATKVKEGAHGGTRGFPVLSYGPGGAKRSAVPAMIATPLCGVDPWAADRRCMANLLC